MKRILMAVLGATVLASAAYAADSIGAFNAATGGDIDGKRLEHYAPAYGQRFQKPAKPAKYDEYLFEGAGGAPVFRRSEKGYGGKSDAAVASAQCDYSLGTNNTPVFGKCPTERNAERILDKDGTNYTAAVREVKTVCPNGSEVFHTGPCGSGQ